MPQQLFGLLPFRIVGKKKNNFSIRPLMILGPWKKRTFSFRSPAAMLRLAIIHQYLNLASVLVFSPSAFHAKKAI